MVWEHQASPGPVFRMASADEDPGQQDGEDCSRVAVEMRVARGGGGGEGEVRDGISNTGWWFVLFKEGTTT
jgi:hypothetical protein